METREIEIDFGKIYRALRHHLWWILLVSVATYGLSAITFRKGPVLSLYSSSATVYSVSKESYRQSLEGRNAMISYADIIKTQKISDQAVLLLNDDSVDSASIMSCVQLKYSEKSPILTIQAVYLDPEMSIKIVNAVANVFVSEMKNITGNDDIQILDEASTYIPYSNEDYTAELNGNLSTKMKRALLAIAVFILLCSGITLHEIFTTKLKTIHECTLGGKLPVLGAIPKYRN